MFWGAPAAPIVALHDAYGFRWVPHQGAGAVRGVTAATAAPGIYVLFLLQVLQDPDTHFGDPANNTELVIPPHVASASLRAVVRAIETLVPAHVPLAVTDADLDRVQTYLDYASDCLDLIYATPVGRRVIDGILATPHKVFIAPGVA